MHGPFDADLGIKRAEISRDQLTCCSEVYKPVHIASWQQDAGPESSHVKFWP